MPWICPLCTRPFKHKNQAHSCVRITVDSHFDHKPVELKQVYDALLRNIKKFGPVSVSPARNAIMFTREGTFLAIKPKRHWLDIEFLLPRQLEDFRIHKTVWASKTRCAHFVRLESPKEIDKQLLGWLKEAYFSAN